MTSYGRLPTGTARGTTGVFSGDAIGHGIVPTTLAQIESGKQTALIYSLIRDNRYTATIQILESEVSSLQSRVSLSLLGYCYYQIQEFGRAAECYENLVRTVPGVMEYRLYYAQSLFKAGQFLAAQRECGLIDPSDSHDEAPFLRVKVVKLETALRYELQDFEGCRDMLAQSLKEEDIQSSNACLLFKEGKVEEARQGYERASVIVGFRPDLLYNTALCCYVMKEYEEAMKLVAQVITRAIKDHPEFAVGMASEGMEVRCVKNSQALHDTYLIESFNLKAAIEYNLKNYVAAQEALLDMPMRAESEVDQVTLHNQGLMNMERDPSSGFEKLGFLLNQTPCPPEVFGNLLLLYLRYDFTDTAADLLAENAHLASTLLSPYLYDFVDATLLRLHAPEEAYKKFDDLADKHVDAMRKLTKQVLDARGNESDEMIKGLVFEYDAAISRYIPILMAQAKIYWDTGEYTMVERIFRKSVEFCNDNTVWKLNVAHVLFMQNDKFKEAITFYEPAVKVQFDEILDVPAIVLANLCVSYIMSSQNDEAEDLMRRIEREEERLLGEDSTRRIYHLCIVNLVIGTLYCSKGNYEFGISRIMKSMEPFNKKLGTDTWYYAKRCFAALFAALAKHLIVLKDSIYAEILEFFDSCEMYGRDIPVVVDSMAPDSKNSPTSRKYSAEHFVNTVSSEARYLKSIFLRIY